MRTATEIVTTATVPQMTQQVIWFPEPQNMTPQNEMQKGLVTKLPNNIIYSSQTLQVKKQRPSCSSTTM